MWSVEAHRKKSRICLDGKTFFSFLGSWEIWVMICCTGGWCLEDNMSRIMNRLALNFIGNVPFPASLCRDYFSDIAYTSYYPDKLRIWDPRARVSKSTIVVVFDKNAFIEDYAKSKHDLKYTFHLQMIFSCYSWLWLTGHSLPVTKISVINFLPHSPY